MKIFTERRQKLINLLEDNSVAIIPGASIRFRNRDSEYLFRQNSDLYYLSGFNEPESFVVIVKENSKKAKSILFNQPRCKKEEVWTGLREGQDGAVDKFNFDESYSINDFDSKIVDLLADKKSVYYPLGRDKKLQRRMVNWIEALRKREREGISAPSNLYDIYETINEMRLFKSKDEIILLEKSAQISANAHCKLMQQAKPDMFEYELEGFFIQECMKHGSRNQSYTPIVAGGNNACILHYTDNQMQLKDGDLLLIDAGGEYQYYASDITRTFPVNGKFTKEQQAIYEIVLNAQIVGIKQCKPGNLWNSIQDEILKVMCQGLIDLDIIKGDCATAIAEKLYLPFYMHKSGHWLGLDVHDVGQYKQNKKWRALEANMALTVEPGIYIAPDEKLVDEKWRGIGVRIEDDVLITDKGHNVMSNHAPKAVNEVEKLCQQ